MKHFSSKIFLIVFISMIFTTVSGQNSHSYMISENRDSKGDVDDPVLGDNNLIVGKWECTSLNENNRRQFIEFNNDGSFLISYSGKEAPSDMKGYYRIETNTLYLQISYYYIDYNDNEFTIKASIVCLDETSLGLIMYDYGDSESLSTYVRMGSEDVNIAQIEHNNINYKIVPRAKTAEVIQSNSGSYSGNIVIPETINYGGIEYNVTSIDEYAFYNCKNLSSITLPNNLKYINDNAFSGCSALYSFIIPDKVIYFGKGALANTSINYIFIPRSVKYGITSSTFLYCHNLNSISVEGGNSSYDSRNNCNAIIKTSSNSLIVGSPMTVIPEDIIEIGEEAFYYKQMIKSVKIPNSVLYIRHAAFAFCSNISSLTLSNNIIEIGPYAFRGCYSLPSLILPNTLKTIDEFAFYDCGSLNSIVSDIKDPFDINEYVFSCEDANIYASATLTVPAGTKSKYQSREGWNLFKNIVEASEVVRKFESGGITYNVNDNGTTVTVTAGNTKYKGSITIPSSVSHNGKNYDVTSIGYGAFSNCTELTSISLGSVMYIQSNAFYGCSGLSSITLPNSLVNIGQYAFIGCSSLTKIVSEIESPFSLEGSTFDDATFNNATLIVPVGTKAAYQAKGGWMGFKNIVEAGSEGGEIGHKIIIDGLCYVISDNNSVYVTEGDTEYKGDIQIPRQVKYNNKTYTVTSIGNMAFEGCSNLTSIIIPNSVIEISDEAFSGCSGLKYISIPNSVKTILFGAFSFCSGLTYITIPNSVTQIGFGAFQGCSNLKTVESHIVIPFDLDVNTFGEDTYKKAELLVPPGIKSTYESKAGWDLFSKITEADNYGYDLVIENDDGVMIYYNYTNDGKELEVVYDPSCIIDGNYTINDSYIVDNIVIPEDVTYMNKTMKVTSVGSYAFSGCNLSSVIIPASMKTLGTSCFDNCDNLRIVYCYALVPPSLIGKKHFELDIEEANVLHVPAESIDAYYNSDWKRYFDLFVPIEGAGISTISSNNTIMEIYSLSGERRNTLSKGINIIKMNDGTTKKVIIK